MGRYTTIRAAKEKNVRLTIPIIGKIVKIESTAEIKEWWTQYIYSDAIRAMNALDESADEILLSAIKNNDMDSYGFFAGCLRGIGDPRGIEKLKCDFRRRSGGTLNIG
jgi:hypothetical protein